MYNLGTHLEAYMCVRGIQGIGAKSGLSRSLSSVCLGTCSRPGGIGCAACRSGVPKEMRSGISLKRAKLGIGLNVCLIQQLDHTCIGLVGENICPVCLKCH